MTQAATPRPGTGSTHDAGAGGGTPTPMNFSTWQDQRTRDPRRLILGSRGWLPTSRALPRLFERAGTVDIVTLDTCGAGLRLQRQIARALGDGLSGPDAWRVVVGLPEEIHREGLDLGEILEAVAAELAARRAALGLDALPTLLLRRFAHRHACGGRLWRWLLAEREAGRIGNLGVCASTPEQAWAALEDPDIRVIRVATSLLDLRLFRQGFFPRARELGRAIQVEDVDLRGLGLRAPETLRGRWADLGGSIRSIGRLASDLGIPIRAVYLAFVRELPGVLPVVDCRDLRQLEEVLSDWVNPAVDGVHLARLVESLPVLPDDFIEPAYADGFDAATILETEANQARAASIATIPA